MIRRRILRSALVATLFSLLQCSTVSTYGDRVHDIRNGAVYYLPTTEFTVAFNTTAKQITLTPVYVADRTMEPFALHHSTNEFFKRNHQVKIEKGLLTSVTLEDEGRLHQIVKDIGDTVALAMKGVEPPTGAGGVGLLEIPDPRDENGDVIPSKEEIEALMNQISDGTKVYVRDSGEGFILPGTDGPVNGTLTVLGSDPGSAKNACLSSIPELKPGRYRPYPGLLARNTSWTGVRVSLLVNRGVIAKMRLERVRAALLELGVVKGKNPAADWVDNDLGRFPLSAKSDEEKKKIEIHRRLTQIEQDLANRIGRKGSLVLLRSQDFEVPVTIDDRTVVIPLQRSPVGRSQNEVELVNGTVGTYSFDHPSAIEGLVKIPMELVKDFLGIPDGGSGDSESDEGEEEETE